MTVIQEEQYEVHPLELRYNNKIMEPEIWFISLSLSNWHRHHNPNKYVVGPLAIYTTKQQLYNCIPQLNDLSKMNRIKKVEAGSNHHPKCRKCR